MAESLPLISVWQFGYTQGNLITRIDYDASSNAIYQGWAQPGTANSDAAWRIVQNSYDVSNRFTGSGFPGDVNGNPSCAFSFVWNNRAGLVYS